MAVESADRSGSEPAVLIGQPAPMTHRAILESPAGQQILQMSQHSAVGTPTQAKDYLDAFVTHADADELIVSTQASRTETWIRSFELLADVAGAPGPSGFLAI